METGSRLIELVDVEYTYPSAYKSSPVLKGVNLIINAEEVIRVTGRNGTGKTTLLKVIANKLVPTHGIRRERKSLRVIYLDQNASEFLGDALTVREQIVVGLGRELHTFESSREGLSRKKILKEVIDYGVGLESKLDSFTAELSGGQRQIVALLSVLLGDAEVLLLDEFTAAMDSDSTRISNEMIRRAVKDKKVSVVFINHTFHDDLQINKEVHLE
jgi:putative ABC transport system ATP-binding protein